MTVKELIEKYENFGSETLKANLLDDIEIAAYIPIEMKQVCIERIIEGVVTNDGLSFSYDSINKYISFIIGLITLYTDLDIESPYEDYDRLVSSNVLDNILERIGDDKDEFLRMFDMRFNDYLRENSIETSLAQLTKAFASTLFSKEGFSELFKTLKE